MKKNKNSLVAIKAAKAENSTIGDVAAVFECAAVLQTKKEHSASQRSNQTYATTAGSYSEAVNNAAEAIRVAWAIAHVVAAGYTAEGDDVTAALAHSAAAQWRVLDAGVKVLEKYKDKLG